MNCVLVTFILLCAAFFSPSVQAKPSVDTGRTWDDEWDNEVEDESGSGSGSGSGFNGEHRPTWNDGWDNDEGEDESGSGSGSGFYVIDGKWSAWGRWSTCTRTCNGGFKTRYRNCDNPAPSIDGQYCKGDEAEKISCNTRRCKAKIHLPPFTCGKSTLSRIVGGSLGKTTDWPWQAGLKRGNDDKIFCGGSIINREWVITAAHCIYRFEPSRTGCVAPEPRLRVILGEFDVDNVEGHEVTRDVAQVCMHPKYQHRTLDYDIALLRLARPIMKFNEHIKPVCMPSSSYVIPIGKNCTVTGFGRLAEDADLSSKLRQASVPIKPLDYCKTQYPLHLVNDRMICAGYEGGQIDACKGDSGGPFVCKDGYNYVLAGAVSWGVGCAKAGQPGLYANIRYFLSWIQTTMKKT